MDLEIVNEEQFILITLDQASLDKNGFDELIRKTGKTFQSQPNNILLDLSQLNNLEENDYPTLQKLNNKINKAKKSFVIATQDEYLHQLAGKYYISTTQTKDKAVDLIFMEELEREFAGSGEDEEG